MKTNRLSRTDYLKQLKLSLNSPISTADFVLVRNKDGQREFLLTRRTEEPYKGSYFIPGGKIIGAETVYDAVKRNAERELGIIHGKVVFINHLSVKNPPKMGIRWLSLWHFHTIEVDENVELRLNGENTQARWFSRINPRWPLPVRQALSMAGF